MRVCIPLCSVFQGFFFFRHIANDLAVFFFFWHVYSAYIVLSNDLGCLEDVYNMSLLQKGKCHIYLRKKPPDNECGNILVNSLVLTDM